MAQKDWSTLIDAYIKGLLNPEQKKAMEEAIENDPALKAQVEEDRLVADILSFKQQQKVDADVRRWIADLEARHRPGAASKSGQAGKPWLRRYRWGIVFFLGALVTLLVWRLSITQPEEPAVPIPSNKVGPELPQASNTAPQTPGSPDIVPTPAPDNRYIAGAFSRFGEQDRLRFQAEKIQDTSINLEVTIYEKLAAGNYGESLQLLDSLEQRDTLMTRQLFILTARVSALFQQKRIKEAHVVIQQYKEKRNASSPFTALRLEYATLLQEMIDPDADTAKIKQSVRRVRQLHDENNEPQFWAISGILKALEGK